MKLFVDENIPLMTVRTLREMGHDVLDIRGTADEGMTDDALWGDDSARQAIVDYDGQRIHTAS